MRRHRRSLDGELRGEEGHLLGHSHAEERLLQSWREGGGRGPAPPRVSAEFPVRPPGDPQRPEMAAFNFHLYVCLTQERGHGTQHAAPHHPPARKLGPSQHPLPAQAQLPASLPGSVPARLTFCSPDSRYVVDTFLRLPSSGGRRPWVSALLLLIRCYFGEAWGWGGTVTCRQNCRLSVALRANSVLLRGHVKRGPLSLRRSHLHPLHVWLLPVLQLDCVIAAKDDSRACWGRRRTRFYRNPPKSSGLAWTG